MRISTLMTMGLALVLGAVIEGCAIGVRFIHVPEMDALSVLLHVPALSVISLLLDQRNVAHDDAIKYVVICQAVIWAVVAYLFLLWAKWKRRLNPRPR